MNIKQRIDRFFRRHYVTKKLSTVNIPFCTTRETLDICRIYIEQEKPGAFLRFGDGDVWIANGKEDMLQEQNHRMTLEMIEAFSLVGDGILKTLPLNSCRFGYEKGMSPGVHLMDDETVEKILSSTFEYFVGSIIYNTVALHHIAVVDTQYCIRAFPFSFFMSC